MSPVAARLKHYRGLLRCSVITSISTANQRPWRPTRGKGQLETVELPRVEPQATHLCAVRAATCEPVKKAQDHNRQHLLLASHQGTLSFKDLLGFDDFVGLAMGFAEEQLVDARSVPAGLRCVICQEVFEDPLCGIECQHVFCSSCIHRALTTRPQCPLCREPMDRALLRPSQPIRALLDDLLVKCDSACYGCGWTGPLFL